MISNVIRRKIVNYLLGNELIIEKTEKLGGEINIEFIDLERRLNYGKWRFEAISSRDYKIKR